MATPWPSRLSSVFSAANTAVAARITKPKTAVFFISLARFLSLAVRVAGTAKVSCSWAVETSALAANRTNNTRPSAHAEVSMVGTSLVGLRQAGRTREECSLRSGAYALRLAVTEEDRRAAYRLRFLVFNLELKEGLESAYRDGY